MYFQRNNILLKQWDYKYGYYFITICTKNREELFGEIINSQMIFNEIGNMINKCWLDIPNRFINVSLGAYIIMPNHIHGIIILDSISVGATLEVALSEKQNISQNNNKNIFESNINMTGDLNRATSRVAPTLGQIIGAFKSISTVKIIKQFRGKGDYSQIWQRNYYEHIIRNEKSLERISAYILNNPLAWETDRYNPKNK